jgi:hypothetical protein
MLGGGGGGKSWKRREFYFLFSVNVMTLSNSRIKEIYDYKPLVSLKLKSKSLPLGAKCRMLYIYFGPTPLAIRKIQIKGPTTLVLHCT